MASAPPDSGRPLELSLTMLAGCSPGEVFVRPGAASLKLGRIKTGNTFTFKAATVSSRHAELVWDDTEAAGGGTWYLVDLDSSNGTQLNGNRKCLAGQRYPLRDQDVIHLGPETQLQVNIAPREPAAGALTVEQKLALDAERIAASIMAAAAAAAASIREDWQQQRQDLERLLEAC